MTTCRGWVAGASLAAVLASAVLATAVLATAVLARPVRAQSGYRAVTEWLEAAAKGAPLPSPLGVRIAFGADGIPLSDALDALRARAGLALAYGEDVDRVRRVRVALDTMSAARHLVRLLQGTGFTAMADATGAVVVRRVPPPAASAVPPRFRLSGYVRHQDTRDVVRYARLTADGDSVRTQSNADGRYTLFLSPGRHRLRVAAIGFIPLDTVVDLTASTTLDVAIAPRPVQLERASVLADPDEPDVDLRSPSMSVARLDLDVIKSAPALLGEVDPIRSLMLLPGVSRTSDFTTVFSVRGGGGDQNLVLLDGATVYNPTHGFGFLSVFNTDAVADVTLHKGAIPARYGGRLSSVLDVRQREGNASRFGGTASAGILASRLMLEGPMPGLGGSFLVAGRRTYADVFLRFSPDSAMRDVTAYFYDVNAKWSRAVGRTGSLFASGYAGRDHHSFPGVASAWGNVTGTVRWNQFVANRLFHKLTLSSSDYRYAIGLSAFATRARWTSRIATTEARVDEQWQLDPRQRIEFGGEAAGTVIRPGDLVSAESSAERGSLTPVRVPARRLATAAAYVGYDMELGDRVGASFGVRHAWARRLGPQLLYRYDGDAAVVFDTGTGRFVPGRLRDSVAVGAGARLAAGGGFEPRAAVRVSLGASSSLKASWARTRQFLMLASRTNTPIPTDVWEPFGPTLAPLVGDQFALGWAGVSGGGIWEATAELYWRRLANIVDFAEGQDLVLNPRLETAFVQGDGRAYGLELFLRRRTGRTNGWISYTLGRSEQRFSVGPGLGINGGAWMPMPTDKRHDLSVVLVRSLDGRWSLGGTFVFASGLPTSLPVSRYTLDGIIVPEYGLRNGGRLPPYHRLDLTLTRTTPRTELTLGVVNAYNRFNAQSLFFRESRTDPLRTEAVQTAIFGIMPSLSWTIRF